MKRRNFHKNTGIAALPISYLYTPKLHQFSIVLSTFLNSKANEAVLLVFPDLKMP